MAEGENRLLRVFFSDLQFLVGKENKSIHAIVVAVIVTTTTVSHFSSLSLSPEATEHPHPLEDYLLGLELGSL